MIFVYRFCDGNSLFAVAEYQQPFANRRIPNWRVFTGRLSGVRIAAERGVKESVKEKGIVRMVHRSPRTSTRRIARRLHVPHTRMWRTLHAEGMYPYHVQRVQHLWPGDFAERLNFCKSYLEIYFCMCVFMCGYLCMCVYVCMIVHVYLCMCKYMYECMYVRVYASMWACMCVCVYMYESINFWLNVCTYAIMCGFVFT